MQALFLGMIPTSGGFWACAGASQDAAIVAQALTRYRRQGEVITLAEYTERFACHNETYVANLDGGETLRLDLLVSQQRAQAA